METGRPGVTSALSRGLRLVARNLFAEVRIVRLALANRHA